LVVVAELVLAVEAVPALQIGGEFELVERFRIGVSGTLCTMLAVGSPTHGLTCIWHDLTSFVALPATQPRALGCVGAAAVLPDASALLRRHPSCRQNAADFGAAGAANGSCAEGGPNGVDAVAAAVHCRDDAVDTDRPTGADDGAA